MHKHLITKSTLLLLLIFTSLTSFALEVPAPSTYYINDYTGTIDQTTINTLNEMLKQYEGNTTNQVVVVIFKSLEGENLEDFTHKLATKWQVGQKGKDNGAVLSVFLNDRKMRIEVGYGLESTLTDLRASQIIRSVIAPHFKQGNVANGIQAGIVAIMDIADGHADKYFKDKIANDFNFDWLETLGGILFFALFIGIWIIGIRSVIKGKTYNSSSSSWSSGSGGFSSSSSGGFSSGGGFSGGGGSFGGGGSSGGW
jgi:uncharacterized protein